MPQSPSNALDPAANVLDRTGRSRQRDQARSSARRCAAAKRAALESDQQQAEPSRSDQPAGHGQLSIRGGGWVLPDTRAPLGREIAVISCHPVLLVESLQIAGQAHPHPDSLCSPENGADSSKYVIRYTKRRVNGRNICRRRSTPLGPASEKSRLSEELARSQPPILSTSPQVRQLLLRRLPRRCPSRFSTELWP